MSKHRLTKTQRKNAYRVILSKARKLWLEGTFDPGHDFAKSNMSTKDYMAIEAIVMKYLKKM